MTAFIVSVNDYLYRRNAERCLEFDVTPVKVSGVIHPNKKYGIQKGMSRACVAASGEGGIVLQEDWGFTEAPVWDGQEFVTFAAGLAGDHLCPRAFAAPPEVMKALAEKWRIPGKSACSRWRGIYRGVIIERPITEQL